MTFASSSASPKRIPETKIRSKANALILTTEDGISYAVILRTIKNGAVDLPAYVVDLLALGKVLQMHEL